MPSVFISYTQDNKPIMENLVTQCTKIGLSTWIDKESVQDSEIWEDNIEKAIQNTKIVIALLSPEAKKSFRVGHELLYASKLDKQIIPVLCKGSEIDSIPLGLHNYRYFDLRDNEDENTLKLVVMLYRNIDVDNNFISISPETKRKVNMIEKLIPYFSILIAVISSLVAGIIALIIESGLNNFTIQLPAFLLVLALVIVPLSFAFFITRIYEKFRHNYKNEVLHSINFDILSSERDLEKKIDLLTRN